jgi:hypothetical protein
MAAAKNYKRINGETLGCILSLYLDLKFDIKNISLLEITLQDRDAYFDISTFPILAKNEILMEEVIFKKFNSSPIRSLVASVHW